MKYEYKRLYEVSEADMDELGRQGFKLESHSMIYRGDDDVEVYIFIREMEEVEDGETITHTFDGKKFIEDRCEDCILGLYCNQDNAWLFKDEEENKSSFTGDSDYFKYCPRCGNINK